MKPFWLRINAALAILLSEEYIYVARRKEDVLMGRYMTDRDSERYLTAYKNMITGGSQTLDEAKGVLEL